MSCLDENRRAKLQWHSYGSLVLLNASLCPLLTTYGRQGHGGGSGANPRQQSADGWVTPWDGMWGAHTTGNLGAQIHPTAHLCRNCRTTKHTKQGDAGRTPHTDRADMGFKSTTGVVRQRQDPLNRCVNNYNNNYYNNNNNKQKGSNKRDQITPK